MLASVLDPLYQLMGAVLAAIYSVTPNYAVAITGLTLLVVIVLSPLTIKGTRSMLKMQKLQPDLKRIQAEHKDDRIAMNTAMQALYKEAGVNPVAGCLPLFAQSPFFLALVGVLRGMSSRKVLVEGATFVPKHLPKGSSIYKDIIADKGRLPAFGLDFANIVRDTASEGFVKFIPYLFLVAGVIVLGIFSQRQINRRNPAAAAANPQMQTITKIMPVMLGVFSFITQAGIALYFLISSGARILQQTLMYRLDPSLAESVRENHRKHAEELQSKGVTPGKGKALPAPKGSTKSGKPAPDKGSVPGKSPSGPAGKGLLNQARAAADGPVGGSRPVAKQQQPGRQQPKKRRKGR